MAVRKRAALAVLAGQTHGNPLERERRERQRLRVAPVDAARDAQGVAAFVELTRELVVDRELRGNIEELVVQALE